MNKNGFTKTEDEFILEEVRKNPHKRSTHKLFHEIAIKLGRHTGNSVRYRFRSCLSNKLNYVYKTNKDGDLYFDENNQLIKTKIMPGTLKTRFTAEDDYILCKQVYKKMLEHSINLTDLKNSTVRFCKFILPNKFFELLQNDYPHHTKCAWRDRYRKFAMEFGIKNYINYYEQQIQNKLVPEPMKDYTGKAHR
ncbi:Homeodomain-like protein, partial [Ascoidea rubescens DSM 1968]